MTFAEDVLALLVDPKTFFADSSKISSLKLPILLTAIYAVVTAIVSGQAVANVAPTFGLSGMEGVLWAFGAAVGFLTAFITWVVVTLMFFVFLKLITRTKSGFTPFLAVTGYTSLPLLIGSVLMLIVGLVAEGVFDGWIGFALSFVILLWCVPIWVYGFAAAGEVPVSTVFTAILIPILLMIAFTAWQTDAGIEAANTLRETGGMGGMRM